MSTTSLAAAPDKPRAREQRSPALSRLTPGPVVAITLSILGLFAIYSTCTALWAMWTTDPLKSIGGLVPLVSLLLILRAWRSLDWEMRGTWWGLLILAATIALVHLRDQAVIEFVLSPSWSIVLPPYSLVTLAYTVGAVLLFGGVRLLCTALFPVVLMWFVNPVPHFFNRFVDLPLQHASAVIARGFAHTLGQSLSPDQLRLMFTPQFGMFIAPGCNGLRGAVTMGFIALIAGYLYRFRRRNWILITAAAILLGYVFNFLRLTLLVIYYLIALHIPWLRSRAEMGDYILGACLFFAATILLFTLILRWNPQHDLRIPPLPAPANRSPESSLSPRSVLFRTIAFALLIALGSISYARAIIHAPSSSQATGNPIALFPQHIGSYTIERQWNETLTTGPVVFYWADYAPAGGGPLISVGVSPVLGAHDTLICHAARGDDWLWHGSLALATATVPTSFSVSLFNTGATQYLEAATVCAATACGQYSTDRRHFGFIYSHPDPHALLAQSPSRPIPILLRAETLNTALTPDEARAQLTDSLRHFLAGANLAEFTQPYRRP
ncbi:MAG TPA: exosortase J [Acidobacteriaceae bacterium]|jgi:exosortase J|nr:exosortase J [Acidobacteriaceae bacterium]